MDKSRTAEDDDGECSATAADMASVAAAISAATTTTNSTTDAQHLSLGGASLVLAAATNTTESSDPLTSVSSLSMTASGIETKERKPNTRSNTQPPGTFVYTVDKNDTLTSVAARFQTTPSELVKINRLVSRFVFPGQLLFVPEREPSELDELNDNFADRERCRDSVNSNASSGQLSQSSPKPGHAERVRRSPNTSPVTTSKHLSEDEELDRDCKEKFLKINVKHITDGAGVVSGTLLVTPNCVMFDPHVVDPLVKEHGVETYGVIAPMANVANAALFNDIAIMKVRNAPQQQQNLPQPKIYYAKNCEPLYKRSLQCAAGLDADVTAEMVGVTVSGQPCRSESQQAVKGSVSDKADLDLSEEEEEEEGDGEHHHHHGHHRHHQNETGDNDSIGSCHSDDDDKGDSGTPADDNSEVFVAATTTISTTTNTDSVTTTNTTSVTTTDVSDRPLAVIDESVNIEIVVAEPLSTDDSMTTDHQIIADLPLGGKTDATRTLTDVPEGDSDWHERNLEPLSDAVVSEHGSGQSMLAVGDDENSAQTTSDAWWEPETAQPSQTVVDSCRDRETVTKPDVLSDAGFLQNGQVPGGTREHKEPTPPPPSTNSRMGFLQFLPDGRWPLLSSPAVDEEGATAAAAAATNTTTAADGGGSPPPSATSRLRGALTRKNSSGDVQSKLKVLKRLSNPLWGTDPLGVISGAPEKIKESLDLFSVSASIPRSASPSRDPAPSASSLTATPVSPHSTGSSTTTPSLARSLLKDVSGGFFGGGSGPGTTSGVDVITPLRPTDMTFTSPSPSRGPIALPSPSIDGWVDATKTLLDHRRGSSPDQPGVCEAVNPVYVDMRRYSEVTRTDVRRFALGKHSREDIRVEFKSEITVDDKKDLFQNMDKLIPRPAKSCDDPPWYLRVRMGRPLIKKGPSALTPIMSYGKQSMRSEYWFSIPKDRIDELCTFFHQWAPGVYGDLNEAELEARGMVLLHSDEEDRDDGNDAFKEESSSDADRKKTPSESNSIHRDWEFVSSTDVFEDLETASQDSELPIADMVGGETEILSMIHRAELGRALPARAVGYAWSLIFNASQHGFSLQSMYRKMSKYETPVLLVIQDTDNNVFGALTSCTLRVSDHFYGTGEGFLFTFFPEFKVYRWTGDNVFFIKGNPESLAIGAGDGLFGLWLDGDLYHGRSHRCKTYNNETLSPNEDFLVSKVEAWGFMEFDTETDTTC